MLNFKHVNVHFDYWQVKKTLGINRFLESSNTTKDKKFIYPFIAQHKKICSTKSVLKISKKLDIYTKKIALFQAKNETLEKLRHKFLMYFL